SEHRIDRRDHVGELLVPRERRILDNLADRSNVAGGYGPNPILLEFRVISRPPNALASNLQIRAIVRLDHVPPPFTALLDQAPARCSTAAGRGASFRHERGWIARITLWTLGRAEIGPASSNKEPTRNTVSGLPQPDHARSLTDARGKACSCGEAAC